MCSLSSGLLCSRFLTHRVSSHSPLTATLAAPENRVDHSTPEWPRKPRELLKHNSTRRSSSGPPPCIFQAIHVLLDSCRTDSSGIVTDATPSSGTSTSWIILDTIFYSGRESECEASHDRNGSLLKRLHLRRMKSDLDGKKVRGRRISCFCFRSHRHSLDMCAMNKPSRLSISPYARYALPHSLTPPRRPFGLK